MTISAYKKEYIYIVESALNKQTNKQTKKINSINWIQMK